MIERKITCPRCGQETVYSEANPYRPFCSERCQLLDLGHWASEKYGLPGEPATSDTEVNRNDDDEGRESATIELQPPVTR